MADEIQIYVGVTGKAGKEWRPVAAVRRRDNIYEITGSNPAPALETWPFGPGDLVRCEPYELTDNDVILVATEKLDRIA